MDEAVWVYEVWMSLELARHGAISITVARICHMINYCGGNKPGETTENNQGTPSLFSGHSHHYTPLESIT